MASNQASRCSQADDDYIDMELSSSSNFLRYSISSPPQSIEFEFQMSSVCRDKETSSSPADELFYKGKLLPLLLPPRLQMVQKLLQNHTPTDFDNKKEETLEQSYAIPFIKSSTAPSTNANNTPLESCNISPAESRRVSCELNPHEYCFGWSTEINSFIGKHPKKHYSWTRKLKQSSLGQKIKASRAYLKSLFAKSGCTDGSYPKTLSNVEPETAPKCKDFGSSKTENVAKGNPIGRTDNERYKKPNSLKKSIEKDMVEDSYFNSQRRSFSGALQWHSATKSSFCLSTSSSGSSSASSSSSFSSNGFQDLHLLKRSSSANSEIESPIEGAIAHCKKSQGLLTSGKTASKVGVCSLSASEIAAGGDPEKQPLQGH